MSGIHQNKVREAPDVTARPIEPTHPHAYLWKKSGFSVPYLSLTDSVVWPQNLMVDPIANARRLAGIRSFSNRTNEPNQFCWLSHYIPIYRWSSLIQNR
jgi:hypothetical protein